MDCDLLIRNGTIADGTGGALYQADIAVVDGAIARIGSGEIHVAKEEIDAKGLLVTPGFVDIHTHYDGQITWANALQPSSHHGVTSVVTGNCGVGFAPCRPSDRSRLIELMEGVEDIPEVVLTAGLPWTWQSFGDYLDVIDATPFDSDVAIMLPHAALRVYVMGERAVRREMATAEDVAQMARLARDAIDAGAIGFGTSRSLNHKTLAGELIPTVAAGDDELLAIASAFGAAGTGVLQVVLQEFSSRDDMETSFDLLRRMARTARRPLSFSLSQKYSDPDGWKRLLELTDEANADGLAIRGQVLGRPIGAVIGHEVTLNPFVKCPSYCAIASLPLDDKIRRLHEPELRENILAEFAGLPPSFETRFDRLFPLDDPPDYEPTADRSMQAQAEAAGADPARFTYERLLAEDGHALFLSMALGYANGSLDPAFDMMRNGHTVLGLGDGGAHYGVICDASHTTSMLTHWTRDRTRGPKLGVPEVVRMLSHGTANAVGLHDRGLIRPGYKADFNLIDYDRLGLRRPSVAYDLPAGGRRLHQRAEGYVATIKSGAVTYRDGVATGALPGRLVRGAQAAPR